MAISMEKHAVLIPGITVSFVTVNLGIEVSVDNFQHAS